MNKLLGAELCGVSMGRFWSATSDYDPGANKNFKVNRCKQS